MADIIMAVAVLVGAIAALILAVAGYKRAGRVEMKVGNVTGSVDFVAEQMVPNGGASMRDAINRIEHGQAELVRVVGKIDERLSAVEEAVTRP